MRLRRPSLALLLAFFGQGCERGDQVADGPMTTREHAERLQVDVAVDEAINDPSGGDYAKAVEIIRGSNRPTGVKSFEIGQLILGAYLYPGTRRPPETLQQGLAMVEQAAVEDAESQCPAQQRLRMMFERGLGPNANVIPIDQPVADCWHRLELGQPGDPARCVALRRQRLPKLTS